MSGLIDKFTTMFSGLGTAIGAFASIALVAIYVALVVVVAYFINMLLRNNTKLKKGVSIFISICLAILIMSLISGAGYKGKTS